MSHLVPHTLIHHANRARTKSARFPIAAVIGNRLPASCNRTTKNGARDFATRSRREATPKVSLRPDPGCSTDASHGHSGHKWPFAQNRSLYSNINELNGGGRSHVRTRLCEFTGKEQGISCKFGVRTGPLRHSLTIVPNYCLLFQGVARQFAAIPCSSLEQGRVTVEQGALAGRTGA